MPFCGFNEKMLKGLVALTEGLVEHGLIYRSNENNETIEQAIRREVCDLTRMEIEVNTIQDSAKRLITDGMLKYAMGVYLIMRSRNINDYREVVAKIGEYFHCMDEKYYSELVDKPNDMNKLCGYLNGKDV